MNFNDRKIVAVVRLDGRIYGFDKRTLARALSAPEQRIVGRKVGRKPFGILPKNVLLVIDPFG